MRPGTARAGASSVGFGTAELDKPCYSMPASCFSAFEEIDRDVGPIPPRPIRFTKGGPPCCPQPSNLRRGVTARAEGDAETQVSSRLCVRKLGIGFIVPWRPGRGLDLSAPRCTQSVDKELMSADELRQLEKQQEIERLRAAEKFMKISSGRAQCKGCGYTYDPSVGDPEYPVAKGTQFSDLPDDWLCPVCGLDKKKFEEEAKEIAGFAANQGYGFGTNTWTGEQKSLVIYGALAGSFLLFLLGYFIQ